MGRHPAIAIAAAFVLTGAGDAAALAGSAPVRNARIVEAAPPRSFAQDTTRRRAQPWAAALPAVEVEMIVTRARGSIRLYRDDGAVDTGAVREFARIAASEKDADEPLPERLVQLVIRASHHFGGKKILVVSATRKGAHGKHGTGEAIDFKLQGVQAAVLAAYLRTTPLAGVGIYTHPKTQYVHLDVRDRSCHWLDGSPPRVTWRERLLPDPKREKRDASYEAAMDLPEPEAAEPRAVTPSDAPPRRARAQAPSPSSAPSPRPGRVAHAR